MGTLPEPEYSVNKSGKVVVRITVDQYGSVISATPGHTGTTVQDNTLWAAAKKLLLGKVQHQLVRPCGSGGNNHLYFQAEIKQTGLNNLLIAGVPQ